MSVWLGNGAVKYQYNDRGSIMFQGDILKRLFGSGDDNDHYLARVLVYDDLGCVRTRGEPSTVRDLSIRYKDTLHLVGEVEKLACKLTRLSKLDAARRRALCLAMICVESVVSKDQKTRDIFSIRFEPKFEGWDHKDMARWFSAGLTQLQLRTAYKMQQQYGINHYDLNGRTRQVLPGDLCIPNIALAYMFCVLDMHLKVTSDPIELRAAYNTGGVYPEDDNVIGLRLHGGLGGFVKFAAYYNDALSIGA